MEEYEFPCIDDRGRLKLPAPVSDYLELQPADDHDPDIAREAETVLDFSVGDWRLWTIEELYRSFDEKLA